MTVAAIALSLAFVATASAVGIFLYADSLFWGMFRR